MGQKRHRVAFFTISIIKIVKRDKIKYMKFYLNLVC